MCGYIGAVGAKAKEARAGIAQGLAAIKHRGPDSSATYADGLCALGFNRLAIIDLSAAANQPFESDRFLLFFNGEIYNYLELKQEFGFDTATSSDTEVLFKVLEKFNGDLPKGLTLLNGMFSLIWYDKREGKLCLVRDRLGVKPLFYAVREDTLFFGSEIKGFRHFLPPLAVDHGPVANFLFARTLDQDRRTFFKDVWQVQPGCFLEVSRPEGGRLDHREVRYWDMARRPAPAAEPEEKVLERFRKIFFDAVKVRLRADVPLAALLSGGLDSSAVAGVMAELAPGHPIASITATYPGDPFDERQFAEKVVHKYPDIKPSWVEIDLGRFFEDLPRVILAQETPIADGSMAAHFMLMRKIHELGVKVVLTGSGGDEVLGGYAHTFLPAAEADEVRGLRPGSLNRSSLFHALPAAAKNLLRRFLFRRRFGKYLKDPGLLARVDDFYRHYPGRSILSSYLIQSLAHWSLPGFLHYEDRNSMAFSIEARNPFLDYRLVELMIGLPNRFKIRGGVTKWILRQALADVLPPEIAERKDKLGFHAPIERWSESVPLDYEKDEEFAREFSYLDLSRFKEDARMKWRMYTLWLWYRSCIASGGRFDGAADSG